MTPPALAPVAGSPANVAARIADIRTRFVAPTRTTSPAAAPAGASPSAAAFAEVLAGLGPDGAGAAAPAGAAPDLDALASEYLGIPYAWGGTDPATGLDCSGLLQHLFRRLGVELPRVSRDQATAGTAVGSLAEARPGDLLAFGTPVDHIGVYLGDGRILHAPHRGTTVRIDDLGSRVPSAIRRVLTVPATGLATRPAGGAPAAAPAAIGGGALPRAVDPAVRRHEALFVEAGRAHGLDPALLAAVCQKESNGRPDVVSSAGALGIMQFMPATARARGVDPHDPRSAIFGAAKMLAELRDQFGSMELALAGYNAGPNAVRRAGNTYPSAGVRRYAESVLALAGGPR